MRTASALLLLACCATATATDIQIVNGDGAGEGFNDPMPVDPLPGNPGSTLGEQRLNVFEAAADFWESLLDSSVTIRVSARFNPLSCAAFSATLGSAGPTTVHRGFTGAPVADTWFTQAEANAISGSDLSGQADINATFNSDIDFNDDCLVGTNWWYGIGEPAPFGTIDLYGTVLHEIAHGLGFLDLVNSDGSKFSGFDDIYMTFLRDGSLGLNWPAMTNAERLASFTDNGDLLWTGTEAVSAASVLSSGVVGGLPRMYAPNPFRSGSSISHWDTVLTPNELMEPFSTATFITGLTLAAFTDMGWPVDQLPLGIHDSYDASEDTTLNVNAGSGVLANDLARGNALSASVVDNPSDGSLSLSADGSFSYDPDPNFDGVDAFTYRPASGTNATTVTVFVAGQNDAPTANDDPGFSVTVNGTLDVAAPGVLDNDDDVDGDALTASRVDDVSHGTLNLDADGSFSYSPAADTCDPVTFTYRANDGTVDSNLATASIAIDDCNASIAVDAMASPTSVDEPGAGATVTVTIENNSLAPGDVTIDTLTDSVDGNLAGSGDCALPQMIAVGNSYQC
ncbi:MAG: Ig-like domain-containing protein, partial [Pseudomonadota bacterium]